MGSDSQHYPHELEDPTSLDRDLVSAICWGGTNRTAEAGNQEGAGV